jgi:hypothetical protein
MCRFTSDGVKYNGDLFIVGRDHNVKGIAVKMHAYGKFEHNSIVTQEGWNNVKNKGFGESVYTDNALNLHYFWAIPVHPPRRLGDKPYIDNDLWNDFVNDLFFSRKAIDPMRAYQFLNRVFSWVPHPLFIDV